jgi:hypothetical protein
MTKIMKKQEAMMEEMKKQREQFEAERRLAQGVGGGNEAAGGGGGRTVHVTLTDKNGKTYQVQMAKCVGVVCVILRVCVCDG